MLNVKSHQTHTRGRARTPGAVLETEEFSHASVGKRVRVQAGAISDLPSIAASGTAFGPAGPLGPVSRSLKRVVPLFDQSDFLAWSNSIKLYSLTLSNVKQLQTTHVCLERMLISMEVRKSFQLYPNVA